MPPSSKSKSKTPSNKDENKNGVSKNFYNIINIIKKKKASANSSSSSKSKVGKKNVLIITPVFPPFISVGGGVAITYGALSEKLSNRGHNVTVISPRLG